MDQLCYKCHQEKANYVIRLQLVCKSCFISNTEHTFRCTLKTSIFPKRGESLLICISGGANSSAMLHLIDSCNNPLKTKKMMKFIPTVLHIDESLLYQTPPEITQNFLNEIEDRYHYPIICKKIEDLIPDIIENLPQSSQARSDKIHLAIRSSIISISNQLGFNKIVTGESASRISSQVLSGICKGSGVSVNQYANPCLSLNGISIGKPMRELLDKEVCIYQYLIKAPLIIKLSVISEYSSNSTIDILVQDFLQNLQSKFPSTVHTLLRTASKLVPVNITETCEICNGLKDKPLCSLEKFKINNESICYSCHHFENN